MRSPTLSVCIPTYNYGRFIAQAVESVRAQDDPDLEVLVLDGGSADDTPAVVRSLAAAWPALRYVRQEAPGGIDADLARSVELARGDHVWLLSADDALEGGALRRIRVEFAAGRDLVLCNRTWCDKDLVAVAHQSWLHRGVDRVVDLSRVEEALAYFQAARSLGAVFSFMSCIGFLRAAWMNAQPPAAVRCYTHVGRLFAMARGGAQLGYVAAPLVRCRGGIDSFSAAGLAGRLLIDLQGYRALADTLFPADERVRRAFLAIVRREHPFRRWVRARSEAGDSGAWRPLEDELARYGLSSLERFAIRAAGRGLRTLRAQSLVKSPGALI